MFDIASLDQQRSLSTRLIASSLDRGWTATLLELRRCEETVRKFRLRPTPDLHVVVQTRGTQRVEVFKHGLWSSATYRPGSCGVTASDETDRIRSSCDDTFELAHLFVPQLILREAADALRRPGQTTPGGELSILKADDGLIAATVRALLSALEAGATDLYADQAIHWFATHLLVFHAGADPRHVQAQRDRATDRRLTRAVELIRTRFADPLTLTQLASEAGISKFHFSRLFRARTGRSPHSFLTAARMGAARALLLRTDLPVSEIAARTGYAGAVQFSAAFRRFTGSTPTAVRQLRR